MSLLDKASLVVTPNAYKESKLYSVVPSSGAGDMSVVRATTATRVNSLGLIESVAVNVPRIDYTNGSCPSLLVEPQRTNLFTYSEQFDNAAWSKINSSITANSAISPDGSMNADKIVENNINAAHFVLKSSSYTGTNTLSVFLKKSERDKVIIQLATASLVYYAKLVDLTNGTLLTPPSPFTNITTSSIKNFGNGWFRIDMTLTDTIIETAFFLYNGSSYSYTGDGTSGCFIYGAQLEVGSYATSYVPTVATAVTRNADVISKTAISSLIGQTEGTIFFDGIVNNIQNAFSNILSTNKEVLSNSNIQLGKQQSTNKFIFDLFLGNGTYNSIKLTSTNAFANGVRTKVAIRYKSGDFAMYINGVLQATSSSTYTNNGTKSELFLNDITTYFGYQESVSFNSAQLYKTPLTNSELQSLSTI